MEFLTLPRTEREACKRDSHGEGERVCRVLPICELRPGTKVYYCNRGKALIRRRIGKQSRPAAQFGAHVDAPRVDLSRTRCMSTDELCYFRTHYYGGIKKYQWVTIPLELHGVAVL